MRKINRKSDPSIELQQKKEKMIQEKMSELYCEFEEYLGQNCVKDILPEPKHNEYKTLFNEIKLMNEKKIQFLQSNHQVQKDLRSSSFTEDSFTQTSEHSKQDDLVIQKRKIIELIQQASEEQENQLEIRKQLAKNCNHIVSEISKNEIESLLDVQSKRFKDIEVTHNIASMRCLNSKYKLTKFSTNLKNLYNKEKSYIKSKNKDRYAILDENEAIKKKMSELILKIRELEIQENLQQQEIKWLNDEEQRILDKLSGTNELFWMLDTLDYLRKIFLDKEDNIQGNIDSYSSFFQNSDQLRRRKSFFFSSTDFLSGNNKSEQKEQRVQMIKKLQIFYQDDKVGPLQLADQLIKYYQSIEFRNDSFKNMSSDLISQKTRKQHQYAQLQQQLIEIQESEIIIRYNILSQRGLLNRPKDNELDLMPEILEPFQDQLEIIMSQEQNNLPTNFALEQMQQIEIDQQSRYLNYFQLFDPQILSIYMSLYLCIERLCYICDLISQIEVDQDLVIQETFNSLRSFYASLREGKQIRKGHVKSPSQISMISLFNTPTSSRPQTPKQIQIYPEKSKIDDFQSVLSIQQIENIFIERFNNNLRELNQIVDFFKLNTLVFIHMEEVSLYKYFQQFEIAIDAVCNLYELRSEAVKFYTDQIKQMVEQIHKLLIILRTIKKVKLCKKIKITLPKTLSLESQHYKNYSKMVSIKAETKLNYLEDGQNAKPAPISIILRKNVYEKQQEDDITQFLQKAVGLKKRQVIQKETLEYDQSSSRIFSENRSYRFLQSQKDLVKQAMIIQERNLQLIKRRKNKQIKIYLSVEQTTSFTNLARSTDNLVKKFIPDVQGFRKHSFKAKSFSQNKEPTSIEAALTARNTERRKNIAMHTSINIQEKAYNMSEKQKIQKTVGAVSSVPTFEKLQPLYFSNEMNSFLKQQNSGNQSSQIGSQFGNFSTQTNLKGK